MKYYVKSSTSEVMQRYIEFLQRHHKYTLEGMYTGDYKHIWKEYIGRKT